MLNCYGCGKSGHLKSECLELTKTRKKSNFNFNRKKEKKGRRAYIAWEDNDISSTLSDLDDSEIVDLCLMGHKDQNRMRAYIAWEDNDISSTLSNLDDSEIDQNEEKVQLQFQ